MKRILIILIAAVLIGAGAFYGLGKFSKSEAKSVSTPKETATNNIPWIQLTRLDGSKIVAHDLESNVVLVVFQPDCDHCQREAKEISEHLSSFKKYDLYFISDAEMDKLSQFAKDYKLHGENNVHFVQATANDIFNNFGAIPTPSLYVYSDNGHLEKSFIGETPIENIMNSL
ncbi:peroxiredoxin family protein [Pontibacter silvestris]|uniref:Peroxiredoxin family protein n=1 Tax=Pontibacter silvestris TaxID=2305183 RepID=A0ABW4X1N2_9BACT|nr:redoxin domain-containing protein [Pontibacter silvestris]MCC9136071.1 peroxiredoxin family protein [Pontibacter silvestris]